VPLAALNGWGSRGRVEQWSKRSSANGERAKEGRSEQGKEGAKGTPLPVGAIDCHWKERG
jgi:hypothetical protein